MKVIVDTNRILAALIRKGSSRRILVSDNIEFYTVDYVLREIHKYKELIIRKSEMEEDEIETLLSLVTEKITIISDLRVKSKMKEAISIMKDIDKKDAPILAAALSVENEGIWTHDKHFEKQDKVKIFLDSDLLSYC